MGFLQDLITTQLTNTVKEKLGQKTGTSGDATDDAIQSALTALLGGLQQNVGTKAGADALDTALAKDHDGSILEQMSTALDDSTTNTDGSKILSHIFGAKKESVLDELSKKTGIPKEGMIALLISLAPVVLGKLGQMKKQGDMDADAIADEVKNESAPKGDLLSSLSGMLDQDKDGNVVDDLLSMGGSLFGGKK